MKKLKENGITLVALVVTIIIMLILAGITIGTITGENGLFKRSKDVAKKYEDATTKEENDLTHLGELLNNHKYESIIETYTITYNANGGSGEPKAQIKRKGETITLRAEIPTREGYTFLGWAETIEDANSRKIQYKEKTSFTKDENITLYAVWLKNFILAEAIGKSVDYDVDVDGVKSNYDWKIFYQGTENDGDANGKIFIITADYVPNTILNEKFKNKNTETTIYSTYGRYWSSIPSKQNMSMNNMIMTNLYPLENKDTPSVRYVSTLLNIDNWDNFLDKDEKGNKNFGLFAIGGPTLQMWCASWNCLLQNKGKDEDGFVRIDAVADSSLIGYNVKAGTNTKATLYMNGIQSQPANYKELSKEPYKLFFPHSEVIGECHGYWVASPSNAGPSQIYYAGFVGGIISETYNSYLLRGTTSGLFRF